MTREEMVTGMVLDLDSKRPHKVSEVICVKCGKRWLSVRPADTLLMQLVCETCGSGFVIEIGEVFEEDERGL